MHKIRVALLLLVLPFHPTPCEETAKPDTHAQAAEDLLSLLKLDVIMNQTMDVMLKAQVQQNPDLAQVEDIMRTFFARYLSYEATKPQLLRLYTDAFTETELREMSAFYRTDTGRKCLTVMPELMQKGASIGLELVKEHQGELKTAIEARLRELHQREGKPTSSE